MTEKEATSTVEVLNPLEQAVQAENIEIEEDDLEINDLDSGSEEINNEKDDKKLSDNKIDLTGDDDDDSENETKKEVEEEDIQETPIKFSDEYKQSKSQISSYADKIQDIVEEIDILKPEKPKDMDDEDAVEIYEQEMREYNRQSKLANKKIERLQAKIKDNVRILQDEFASNHPNEDLSKFQSWMQKRQGFLAEFLSGQEDLETFYFLYKKKTGGDKLSKVKKISKGVKEIDISTDAAPIVESKTLLPKKFKYANKPMFKDWVKGFVNDMKSGRSMPDGEPITYALIESLCKQEYELNNLKQVE